jgi:Nucleotidyltransferase/DNA polymerase involved in DNA repair
MFATLYLPKLYLQAAIRHQPELGSKPVALLNDNEKRAVLIQLNEPAEKAGVRTGMTPSQGLARCPSLIVKARACRQEKLIDEILLHYGFTLSPYVEITAPGICTIQFTADRDLMPKVSHVIEQLAECQIIAQAGIALTPDTSFLVAHLARPVLEIENAKKFLAPLPIETLATAI